MSVISELNVLKQPANYRTLVIGGSSQVIYYRGMSLFSLDTASGAKSQVDLDVPHAKTIIAIACHPGSELQIFVGFDTGVIYRYGWQSNSIQQIHNEHKAKGQFLTWMGFHITEQGVVLSVVENTIFQYCTLSKKAKAFNSILPKKFNATEISTTALDTNLLAIGSFCGLVVILSIQDMKIKYSFRGHNYQITSMVWMRSLSDTSANNDDDCFDIYAEDLKEEFGTDNACHLKSNAQEGTTESPPSNNQFDFVEACQVLKDDILRAKEEDVQDDPVQPNRDECKKDLNETDESLPSGFSNDSNASSNIEQLFEKIDITDAEDLSLITLDQHMNVWVWDVRGNRAKGNFKITSRRPKQNKSVYYPAQFYLLGDSQTIVGNTCNAGFFSLLLSFDKQKNQLDFDYQMSENNSMVLASLSKRQFLSYYPYHSLMLMQFDRELKPNYRVVKEFPIYNSVGRTISVCNVNPMRVAIGSHEICLFDLMSVSDSGCKFTTYYKNIKSGIVCLAWHPDIETMAFGTLEGRIGIYNTINQSIEFLKPFSGHEIYDLAFGRINDEMCLFATSNGVCVYYFNQFKEFKVILSDIKDVSALYIDQVKNIMLIGTKLGNLFYRPVDKVQENVPVDPIKISRNYVRMFRVNCDHSKLVVASKFPEVIIMSMADLLDQNPSPTIFKLKGHSQPLVWVDFSSKNPDLLISTSYDQTIRLWDISQISASDEEAATNVTAISCFSFNAKLKYAIFSPLNENCIIVGTQSTPFYVFNMNEKTTEFPPKLAAAKANVQEKTGPATPQNSTTSVKTESKVADSKKTETTVFYLTKRESSKKVLQCLQAIVKADVNNDAGDAYLNQKLFSNDLDRIRDFLLEEAKNYQASNIKSRGTELIALMRGNMKETILHHIQTKSLTDEMVGISPMVSYPFWRQCCEAYSVQMIEEQQPLKAVIYLLGLHMVDDAIKLLCDKNYYREAWILAKLRKFPEDKIFAEISEKWIANLDLYGDYESAAVVAAGINDYKAALDLLLKRREEQLTDEHYELIEALKTKLNSESSAKIN